MALQGMRITVTTAMRARDVSRPTQAHHEFAERRPLRDETSAKQGSSGGKPSRRGK
ncbi:hypothetical protein [Bailinhaonella thermotolerans]|uniref:hypothetical protein n=1 Tax=Bailinhaonella thermotolerans TaxID=1070861 RepID=UPI00192A291D|nr:hypothetical protein [Bailinhaonella thermotolerans]